MAIRIPVTVVVELGDEQEAAYRESFDLPVPTRARDLVESVRADVLHAVRSRGCRVGEGRATVTIKER
jgi:hypothetical protein